MQAHCFLSLRLAGFLLVLTTLSGCSGGGKGEITGEVIYKNNPLPSGIITFHVVDKPGIQIRDEIKEGKYTIRNCPAGLVRVTVETYQRGVGGAGAPPAKDMSKDFAQGFEDAGKNWIFVPIPHRYKDPEKTDLSYEVVKGSQTQDFTLADK